jgi:Flp pilus assembly protein TadD
MAEKRTTGFRRLRKRVERALANGARGSDVLRDLESIIREAEEGDRDALFAHRQLAELRLEESPWRAALHLRKLIAAAAADDGVHALMGLCQAMLGNFKVAISAYRKALELSPRNPWYHHNLGHLLDVGGGNARAAIKHLRFAYELEPAEDEIAASLAHCLARLGELDEARDLAETAVRSAPENVDHQALLEWVQHGAPTGAATERRAGPEARAKVRGSAAARSRELATDPVISLLAEHMPNGGFTQEQLRRAQALWADFSHRHGVRAARPEVYAAAIEYAMAVVHASEGITRAAVGRRYGVTPGSISNRYGEIRSVLGLLPGDPRYCVSMRG